MSRVDTVCSYITNPFLVEGGNVMVDDNVADKLDISTLGRKNLQTELVKLFQSIDQEFNSKFQQNLWEKDELKTKKYYTGSSGNLFDSQIADEEFVQYKKELGDIDITVNKDNMMDLNTLLTESNGKTFGSCKLLGTNKEVLKSDMGQIHALFELTVGSSTVKVQVDFEGSVFENGNPTFATFSHGSNWNDVKDGYKGVAHKLLLRALAKAVSKFENAMYVTPTSTFDKYKISKAKNMENPSFLTFSVAKGLRKKLVPVTNEQGQQLVVDGKKAYKEVKDTSLESYENDIKLIANILFGKELDTVDFKKFGYFVGLLELIEKYKEETVKERVLSSLVGGMFEQQLVRDKPEEDMGIKLPMIGAVIKTLKLPNGKVVPKDSSGIISDTYKSCSFKLHGKEYTVEFDDELSKRFEDYYSNYGNV